MILVLAILAGCAGAAGSDSAADAGTGGTGRRGAGDHDRLPRGVAASRWTEMYAMLAEDQARISEDAFRTLLVDFRRLTGVTDMTWTVGQPERVVLPAAPRPGPAAADAVARAVAGSVGQSDADRHAAAHSLRHAGAAGHAARWPAARPAVGGGAGGHHRALRRCRARSRPAPGRSQDGWKVRWRPDLLFPELGEGGRFRLRREAPVRGSIVAQDGTVFARTRDDGARVYPQEWLAARPSAMPPRPLPKTCTPASAWDFVAATWSVAADSSREPMRCWPAHRASSCRRFRRGRPGGRAAPRDGPRGGHHHHHPPGIQATADAVIAGYNEAGTAVIDPRSGDVWALSSAPLFNPNAMTIGTTLSGTPLAALSEAAG